MQHPAISPSYAFNQTITTYQESPNSPPIAYLPVSQPFIRAEKLEPAAPRTTHDDVPPFTPKNTRSKPSTFYRRLSKISSEAQKRSTILERAADEGEIDELAEIAEMDVEVEMEEGKAGDAGATSMRGTQNLENSENMAVGPDVSLDRNDLPRMDVPLVSMKRSQEGQTSRPAEPGITGDGNDTPALANQSMPLTADRLALASSGGLGPATPPIQDDRHIQPFNRNSIPPSQLFDHGAILSSPLTSLDLDQTGEASNLDASREAAHHEQHSPEMSKLFDRPNTSTPKHDSFSSSPATKPRSQNFHGLATQYPTSHPIAGSPNTTAVDQSLLSGPEVLVPATSSLPSSPEL